MKLQESIPLSSIYRREEDFSEALAKLLRREDVLKIGTFGDDVETESPVGLHRADIVAFGEAGVGKTSSARPIGIIGAGLNPTPD